MQDRAPSRRAALDDETEGPPLPSPVLPMRSAPTSGTLAVLDRLGMIEFLAAG